MQRRRERTGEGVLLHLERATTPVASPQHTDMGEMKDVSADIGRKDFRGPDPLNIHVSKALGEAPYVGADPQYKSVCLTNSIKNIAIKINSGLQDIQVLTLTLHKRGIYTKACGFFYDKTLLCSEHLDTAAQLQPFLGYFHYI